ncbi:hypothetical protein ACROYT_G023573 [Oculina patagonica]
MLLLPDTKSSWCMATDIKQSIEEKGCETKVSKNKACVGQCFSYYSPGTFPVRYAARKRTKYCDVCKPSLKSWTKISLNCPGKKNSQVNKLVEKIYDCSCKRCGRDPKKQNIKTKPVLVSKANESKVWHTLYDEKPSKVVFKFKVGEQVRISKAKRTFEKGYLPSWTTEIFTISERLPRNPPVYKLKEFDGEELDGTFYEKELVRVVKKADDLYKIEKILETIILQGDWEVGLASITFPHTWFNIQSGKSNFMYYDANVGDWLVGLPPDGYYHTIPSVINAIMKEINSQKRENVYIQLSFDTMSERVTVTLGNGSKLHLGENLGLMLGFGGEITLTETTTAPYISDVSDGIQSIYIYSNIVDSQIVGDVRAPLLRIVPAEGNNGSIINKNFDNPQYLPVGTKEFETIELLIRDDVGRKISFERGRVVITLSFRLRQSPNFS